ncbi:hypothetical protein [Heyndrickxia coagulans]|uniref:hypothetical protein n=1 Tax=Heyndrickxia coagulans TaxID=1398 RepID=UPI002E1D389C|nr:hypothetical protein [Heyndrickxia coagulans]
MGLKKPKKATHLTGFFFGMLAGFNFGLFWHFPFFRFFGFLDVLDLPVINGLVVGSICAALGHRIESLCDKHGELPTTYQPYGLIEVGASRLIVAFTSQRKLTELTLLFQEFCYL